MRSFLKGKNRSQQSIDRSTGSRPSSPDYAAGGGAPSAQSASGDRFGQQTVQSIPYQDPQVHSHPAHVLTRNSAEAPAGYVDTVRRGSVPLNVVPAISTQSIAPSDLQGPAPVPGQTQFGQSKNVHVPPEKEHKWKSSIFGWGCSKETDKEHSRI